MFGGVVFTIFPVFGSALSFLAPLLAIAGTVMGGLSYSRAKREGMSTGAPLAGIIVNAIAFLPAVAVAMTCGLCNACITAQSVNPPRPPDGGWPAADAGVAPVAAPPGAPPPAFPPPPMDPG